MQNFLTHTTDLSDGSVETAIIWPTTCLAVLHYSPAPSCLTGESSIPRLLTGEVVTIKAARVATADERPNVPIPSVAVIAVLWKDGESDIFTFDATELYATGFTSA